MGLERYITTVLNSPKKVSREKVIEVCDFLEGSFPDCSLFQVGKFMLTAAIGDKGPKAVLTFNADTFLETYIDLFARRQHYLSPPPHGHPPYYYVAINDSGGGSGGKIPIYHCHGSVAPLEKVGTRPRDRRDRLVFLEQEYLALASGHSAWAQTVFLYHAQTTRMAFCGLSMSDTNIRRWMSAVEVDTKAYHAAMGNTSRENAEHIWIRPQPADTLSQEIILVSMSHLGIRPAWINGWSELEQSLQNLAAVR
ncbi:SIR2 family protein [Methylorubrum sp. POS3]|uniref:SIR2 family protein n=1 Tax=Methylorubrum sp. POS3 TaxID=2998492 RepID=UPI00372934AC